jgi:uncharacterized protein
MAYWDTSCLLKLYAPEADSTDFEVHVMDSVTLVTSVIARLELFAALQYKEAANDLHAGGARQALAAYDSDVALGLISVRAMDSAVVEKFEAIIEQCYRRSPPLYLRTLDAIHLSTATVVEESEIVATDKRLREAALGLGFSIYPAP